MTARQKQSVQWSVVGAILVAVTALYMATDFGIKLGDTASAESVEDHESRIKVLESHDYDQRAWMLRVDTKLDTILVRMERR